MIGKTPIMEIGPHIRTSRISTIATSAPSSLAFIIFGGRFTGQKWVSEIENRNLQFGSSNQNTKWFLVCKYSPTMNKRYLAITITNIVTKNEIKVRPDKMPTGKSPSTSFSRTSSSSPVWFGCLKYSSNSGRLR